MRIDLLKIPLPLRERMKSVRRGEGEGLLFNSHCQGGRRGFIPPFLKEVASLRAGGFVNTSKSLPPTYRRGTPFKKGELTCPTLPTGRHAPLNKGGI